MRQISLRQKLGNVKEQKGKILNTTHIAINFHTESQIAVTTMTGISQTSIE